MALWCGFVFLTGDHGDLFYFSVRFFPPVTGSCGRPPHIGQYLLFRNSRHAQVPGQVTCENHHEMLPGRRPPVSVPGIPVASVAGISIGSIATAGCPLSKGARASETPYKCSGCETIGKKHTIIIKTMLVIHYTPAFLANIFIYHIYVVW